MMTYPKMVVLFFFAMIAQWWWSTHATIWGLAPQLLLVLTVSIAARFGPVRGMFMGFFWGLFLDMLAGRLFGANAFALTLVAYGTGSARRQVDLLGVAPQSVAVFVLTWAYFLIIGLLGFLFLKTFIWVGWAPFLLDPIYNCFVALMLFIFWEPMIERR